MTALDKQEGGTHYKDCPIQPIEYILANRLNWCEGNVVKYITRHSSKHGKEDLLKVIHYVELLLEKEYGTSREKEATKTKETEAEPDSVFSNPDLFRPATLADVKGYIPASIKQTQETTTTEGD